MPDGRGSNVVAIDGYRQLPQNEEAEQALLGALLIDNHCHDQLPTGFSGEHFFVPVHQRIFEAADKIIKRRQVANPVTLSSYFKQDDSLAEIGGDAYLARLAASAASIINTADYADAISECYQRRTMIAIHAEAVNRLFDPSVEDRADMMREEAEAQLFAMSETGETRGMKTFAQAAAGALEMAETAYQRDSGLAGISTGLKALDDLLGGLVPSDMLIIAGRPGMGKSALAVNIATNAAAAGEPVAIFSLEMSSEQIAGRILADRAQITTDRIRRGKIGTDEFMRLAEASRELSALPVFIDDSPALTIGQIHARARRQKTSSQYSAGRRRLSAIDQAGREGRPQPRRRHYENHTGPKGHRQGLEPAGDRP